MRITDVREGVRGCGGKFSSGHGRSLNVSGEFLADHRGVEIVMLQIRGSIDGPAIRSVSVSRLKEQIDKELRNLTRRSRWT